MPQVAMIRTEELKIGGVEPDWGDIVFCRRDCNNYGGPLATIFCACGVKYKNCVGIMPRANELSEKICGATLDDNKKIVGEKKVSLIKISNPKKYEGEKLITAVSKDYNCGWVYMKNNKLFLGRNCCGENLNCNKDCVIFWEEKFIKDNKPININVPINIIGNFKGKCF
jgi:hypothetical protein